ncbi:MAG: PIN domain-containing protein [Chloroflexi bacterium]|nr:PIN domain-containing protein [Chloroflexota bacterium]
MRVDLYLVDTSVWLDVLPLGRDDTKLRQRVDVLLAADVVAITGIVRLELLAGARTEAEYRRLGDLLTALHPLRAVEERWEEAGKLGFALRRHGVAVPSSDLLIAAIAMHAGAVLIHRDRHFDLIAAKLPLRVESHIPMEG